MDAHEVDRVKEKKTTWIRTWGLQSDPLPLERQSQMPRSLWAFGCRNKTDMDVQGT